LYFKIDTLILFEINKKFSAAFNGLIVIPDSKTLRFLIHYTDYWNTRTVYWKNVCACFIDYIEHSLRAYHRKPYRAMNKRSMVFYSLNEKGVEI